MPEPSPYVARMRRLVGHDLLLLPAVSVLIRDDGGRLLVVKQADRQQWGTVGGAVEPGESPRQAAQREVAEETGLTVELGRLVDVYGGPTFETVYPNGDHCAYVLIVFEAKVTGGTARADGDEVVDLRWVQSGDLAALDLTRMSRELLTRLDLL